MTFNFSNLHFISKYLVFVFLQSKLFQKCLDFQEAWIWEVGHFELLKSSVTTLRLGCIACLISSFHHL